jgi:hypothetical protein
LNFLNCCQTNLIKINALNLELSFYLTAKMPHKCCWFIWRPKRMREYSGWLLNPPQNEWMNEANLWGQQTLQLHVPCPCLMRGWVGMGGAVSVIPCNWRLNGSEGRGKEEIMWALRRQEREQRIEALKPKQWQVRRSRDLLLYLWPAAGKANRGGRVIFVSTREDLHNPILTCKWGGRIKHTHKSGAGPNWQCAWINGVNQSFLGLGCWTKVFGFVLLVAPQSCWACGSHFAIQTVTFTAVQGNFGCVKCVWGKI